MEFSTMIILIILCISTLVTIFSVAFARYAMKKLDTMIEQQSKPADRAESFIMTDVALEWNDSIVDVDKTLFQLTRSVGGLYVMNGDIHIKRDANKDEGIVKLFTIRHVDGSKFYGTNGSRISIPLTYYYTHPEDDTRPYGVRGGSILWLQSELDKSDSDFITGYIKSNGGADLWTYGLSYAGPLAMRSDKPLSTPIPEVVNEPLSAEKEQFIRGLMSAN